MYAQDYDGLILPAGGVRGDLRFARRLVGHTQGQTVKREGNKKARRVTRSALKGHFGAVKGFSPSTAYDLS